MVVAESETTSAVWSLLHCSMETVICSTWMRSRDGEARSSLLLATFSMETSSVRCGRGSDTDEASLRALGDLFAEAPSS